MKRKRFFQLSPLLTIVMNGALIGVMIGGLSVLTIPSLHKDFIINDEGVYDFSSFLRIAIFFAGVIYAAVLFVQYNNHWIDFNIEHINVPFDFRAKRNRIQYKVEIRYDYIMEVYFERSVKSSKGKVIEEERMRPFYHQYLVLVLRNGKREKIMVDYFTNQQKKKILYELVSRVETFGGKIDLTNAEKSLFKLKGFGVRSIMDVSDRLGRKSRKQKK